MHAGLPRRLAAMFYDGLLLVAILMIATALMLLLTPSRQWTTRGSSSRTGW